MFVVLADRGSVGVGSLCARNGVNPVCHVFFPCWTEAESETEEQGTYSKPLSTSAKSNHVTQYTN